MDDVCAGEFNITCVVAENNSALTENVTTNNALPRDSTPIPVIALEYIQLYYTPILVVLGCLGNCLSVFVFFGTKLRKLSSSYYLSALAISDCGFLIAQFVTWLNLIDIPLFNEPGFCQLAIYFSHLCSFISVWLVVLFTIERFIAVRYPLHKPAVCTIARAKLFITCLTMIGLPAYSPYFLVAAPQNVTEVYNKNTSVSVQMCALVTEHMDLASILNHIDFSLTLVLPFCIIAVLNSLICRTVTKLATVRHTMTLTTRKRLLNQRHSREQMPAREQNSRTRQPSVASQNKVTHMLLVVSTVFILLNLPSYIFRIYVYINKKADTSGREDILLITLQHYANVLFATNFGINFILYCISGQNFRGSIRSLFCRGKVRKRKEQITQATILSELSRGGGTTNSIMKKTGILNDCSSIEMQTLNVHSATTNATDYFGSYV